MRFKDILVHLDGTEQAETRLRLAADLARRHEAHLTALHVLDLELPALIASEASGAAVLADLLEDMRRDALAARPRRKRPSASGCGSTGSRASGARWKGSSGTKWRCTPATPTWWWSGRRIRTATGPAQRRGRAGLVHLRPPGSGGALRGALRNGRPQGAHRMERQPRGGARGERRPAADRAGGGRDGARRQPALRPGRARRGAGGRHRPPPRAPRPQGGGPAHGRAGDRRRRR